jgi:hypothetical protein
MTILYAITRYLGFAGCACLLLLWHYEGIPGAAKLRFPETWPIVGGFGLVDVPLVGDLTVGKVESYAAEQVRIAKATMVSAYEYGALEAQLNKERDLRLKGSQALEEYRKRADAALSAEQSDNDRMEQEIADYEAKLADANRCRITPGLREWLQSK